VILRLLHEPLSFAKQKLSPPRLRTLGGCSKFQIGYYTPKHAERRSRIE
jgi:hypothetical protein